MVLNWQASIRISIRFQCASMSWLFSASITIEPCSHITRHDCITIMCHIWMDQAPCCLSLIIWIVAEARRGAVRSALFWRAADGCIRECCFALVEYLLYTRMRSNLKTAPNIGEVSLMAAIGPLLEWNVPVLPMASRQSQAPQTSGPYCLCHPFPPTSDARPCLWALCLSTGVWLHSAHVVF